ncbi:MAG: hypothetical protein ACLFVO_03175 [Chloroflexaceae bacterium]
MDHEQHDMRETRETVNAAMDQVIPRLVGDITSGRAEEEKVPCCRRRLCRSPGEMPGLMNDRVSRDCE